jgi:hypothetical protein
MFALRQDHTSLDSYVTRIYLKPPKKCQIMEKTVKKLVEPTEKLVYTTYFLTIKPLENNDENYKTT